LKRHKVSRRRITTDRKSISSPEEIREKLKKNQDVITTGGYSLSQILNLDETALNFGIGPTYVYIPQDAQRGLSEGSNVKARVTVVPTVDAEGTFLPLMFILKHSKSSEQCPDQTSMRVIPFLHLKEGYTVNDGWDLLQWQRLLTLTKGRVTKTELHTVNFLKHRGEDIIIKTLMLQILLLFRF
jgi:hypothetical protein